MTVAHDARPGATPAGSAAATPVKFFP